MQPSPSKIPAYHAMVGSGASSVSTRESPLGVIGFKFFLLSARLVDWGCGLFSPALRAIPEGIKKVKTGSARELFILEVELCERGGLAEIQLSALEVRLEREDANFFVLRPWLDDIQSHGQVSVLRILA